MRKIKRTGPAIKKADLDRSKSAFGSSSEELFFGDDLDQNFGRDFCHQADDDREFADRLDGSERCANLALLDGETELVDRFSDIGVRDGTKETAVDTGLAGDFDGLTVQLVGDVLSRGDTFSLSLFEFGATSLEFRDGGLRGAFGMTLGDQEVTGVAVFNLHNGTEFTEMVDFFEKNNLHD